MQNKHPSKKISLRIVNKTAYRESTSPFFSHLHTLQFKDLVDVKIIQFMLLVHSVHSNGYSINPRKERILNYNAFALKGTQIYIICKAECRKLFTYMWVFFCCVIHSLVCDVHSISLDSPSTALLSSKSLTPFAHKEAKVKNFHNTGTTEQKYNGCILFCFYLICCPAGDLWDHDFTPACFHVRPTARRQMDGLTAELM